MMTWERKYKENFMMVDALLVAQFFVDQNWYRGVSVNFDYCTTEYIFIK